MGSIFKIDNVGAKCIWVQLLSLLGQTLTENCGNCSICKPIDSDFSMVTTEICYLTKTPKLEIPVYAFCQDNDSSNIVNLSDLVKRTLTRYQRYIVASRT